MTVSGSFFSILRAVGASSDFIFFLTDDFNQIIDRAVKTGVEKVSPQTTVRCELVPPSVVADESAHSVTVHDHRRKPRRQQRSSEAG